MNGYLFYFTDKGEKWHYINTPEEDGQLYWLPIKQQSNKLYLKLESYKTMSCNTPKLSLCKNVNKYESVPLKHKQ